MRRRARLGLCTALLCCLLACSGDRNSDSKCKPGSDVCASATGGAGGSAFGGSGGNVAPGSGGAPAIDGGGRTRRDGGLNVHVENDAAMTIEVVTLECDGDCADVEAVARGGNPPYTFTWDDGSKTAKRHVCRQAAAELTISATDTAITSDEFEEYAAQTVMAVVDVKVLECEDTDMTGPPPPCEDRVDTDSFDPIVKWSWDGEGSMSTPLVANLTDDNDDGVIDTDDIPDVVLVNAPPIANALGELVILSGRDGTEHFRIPGVAGGSVPALGDIDGDRQVDIVTVLGESALAAYDHAGKELWATNSFQLPTREGTQIALADLDHDGAPEIIAGDTVFDSQGVTRWQADVTDVGQWTSAVAADLDDDGYLEVVWGAAAYRHDGTLYYRNVDLLEGFAPNSGTPNSFGQFVAIADLDADGVPEIVAVNPSKMVVLDHMGKTLRSIARNGEGFPFPPAIADLDGDGTPEILLSAGEEFSAYTAALDTDWSMPVSDPSGIAAGTAFDFLGDGTAEAMYGDEETSWGFDGADGHVIFQQPRNSGTLLEYPSVADVDNDGSADILITSNNVGSAMAPTLQVLSDSQGRWIPARRILNQEAYHVTNVNEDGTIPRHEFPSWKLNNTFRAQAQINPGGKVCLPAERILPAGR